MMCGPPCNVSPLFQHTSGSAGDCWQDSRLINDYIQQVSRLTVSSDLSLWRKQSMDCSSAQSDALPPPYAPTEVSERRTELRQGRRQCASFTASSLWIFKRTEVFFWWLSLPCMEKIYILLKVPYHKKKKIKSLRFLTISVSCLSIKIWEKSIFCLLLFLRKCVWPGASSSIPWLQHLQALKYILLINTGPVSR